MYQIIQYTSPYDIGNPFDKYVPTIDRIQKIIVSLITNEFFPWVFLIILINRKNWKRPVIIILILHWLLRAIGDALREAGELLPIPKDKRTLWPNTNARWIVGNAVAHLFWLSGEIFGDWYLYLRTKAVTINTVKINIVFYCCIIYNLVKFAGIASYFIYLPLDFNQVNKYGRQQNGLQLFDITWWTIVAVYHIVGFVYDFSVMHALTTELFSKLKEYKTFSKNTFMDKFKQISELRIFVTMGATIIFLPFIIVIVFILINQYKKKVITFIDPDPIRQIPLSLCYNLIYIDQILLKCFVERQYMKTNKPNNDETNKSNNSNVNILLSKSFNSSFSYRKLESNQNKGDVSIISGSNINTNSIDIVRPETAKNDNTIHNNNKSESSNNDSIIQINNGNHSFNKSISSVDMDLISNLNINKNNKNSFENYTTKQSQIYFNNIKNF